MVGGYSRLVNVALIFPQKLSCLPWPTHLHRTSQLVKVMWDIRHKLLLFSTLLFILGSLILSVCVEYSQRESELNFSVNVIDAKLDPSTNYKNNIKIHLMHDILVWSVIWASSGFRPCKKKSLDSNPIIWRFSTKHTCNIKILHKTPLTPSRRWRGTPLCNYFYFYFF